MKKGFEILKKNPYEDTDLTIKNYYFSWREFNKGNQDGQETFAMLFTSFKDNYLADIEGGALKLYLFFCFNANNNYGDSWWSIEKVAEQLKVGTRTINKWMKVLVDKQLIYRDITNHRSLTTYLLPHSTALMEVDTKISHVVDSQTIVEDVISSLQKQEKVFGTLIGIFHIFQWEKSKNIRNTGNVQWLLFITKRSNDILTGHFHQLKNSKHIVVSKRPIDNAYFFHSPFIHQNSPILGIALENEVDITSNPFGPMKALIEYLAEFNVASIDPNQIIDYGPLETEEENLE